MYSVLVTLLSFLTLSIACNSDHNMSSSDIVTDEANIVSDRKVVSSDDVVVTSEEDLGSVTCLNDNQIIRKGEQATFAWEIVASEDYTFEASISYEGEADVGSVSYNPENKLATYTAPSAIPQELKLAINGQLSSGMAASCQFTLMADGDIGVVDDGKVAGLVGKVYQLPENTSQLPDFSTMQELTTIVSKDINVAARRFDTGFPGLADLFEWFGIAFKGKIEIKEAGNYTFRLHSDDGSKLYINDELIISNDGTHGPRSVDGSIFLEAGTHNLAIDYFQGPRFQIALQFLWSPADDGQFEIVPSTILSR